MKVTYKVVSTFSENQFSSAEEVENKLNELASTGWRVICNSPYGLILEHMLSEEE